MVDFFIKVKHHEKQNLPFVLYRKPKKNKIVGLFQKNDSVFISENLEERGFVFAPFEGNRRILIPEEQSEKWITQFNSLKHYKTESFPKETNIESQNDFEGLVQNAIDAIQSGMLSKIVVSRQEHFDLGEYDIVLMFEKLVQLYPKAFTYCWFHPKVGLWMGASPERLLKSKNKRFKTVALAGTQLYKKKADPVWSEKDKQEQQMVTDYIFKNVEDLLSEVSVSSPFTVKAGGLLHIKTEIEGEINENASLYNIVEALHPTPAVCGLPKESAKTFIVENEGYKRTYYTGYLGELNQKITVEGDIETDLYVNLRCIQIKNNKAIVYVGCGITKDSNPTKEWEETVIKSFTMRNVLQSDEI